MKIQSWSSNQAKQCCPVQASENPKIPSLHYLHPFQNFLIYLSIKVSRIWPTHMKLFIAI